jgi:hypothetical protein
LRAGLGVEGGERCGEDLGGGFQSCSFVSFSLAHNSGDRSLSSKPSLASVGSKGKGRAMEVSLCNSSWLRLRAELRDWRKTRESGYMLAWTRLTNVADLGCGAPRHDYMKIPVGCLQLPDHRDPNLEGS